MHASLKPMSITATGELGMRVENIGLESGETECKLSLFIVSAALTKSSNEGGDAGTAVLEAPAFLDWAGIHR
jgi:hypothetical protein